VHPPIKGDRTLLTPAAWLDPHRVRGPLDDIAETDLLVDKETRQPHYVRFPVAGIVLCCVLALSVHVTTVVDTPMVDALIAS